MAFPGPPAAPVQASPNPQSGADVSRVTPGFVIVVRAFAAGVITQRSIAMAV
jgi:hypothetical protein